MLSQTVADAEPDDRVHVERREPQRPGPFTAAEADEIDFRDQKVGPALLSSAIGDYEARHADTFAGAIVDNIAGGKAVFFFTGDLAAPTAELRALYPYPDRLVVKQVDYSLAELQSLQSHISAVGLKTKGVDLTGIGVDLAANSLEAGVSGDGAAALPVFKAVVGDAPINIVHAAAPLNQSGPEVDSPPARGGMFIDTNWNNRNVSNHQCTTGFVFVQTGNQYLSTAGHCYGAWGYVMYNITTTLATASYMGPHRCADQYGGGDISNDGSGVPCTADVNWMGPVGAWNQVATHEIVNNQFTTTPLMWPIRSRQNPGGSWPGEFLCSARGSGDGCGAVKISDFSHPHPWGGWLHHQIYSSLYTQYWDSGSPAFDWYMAVGTDIGSWDDHSGGGATQVLSPAWAMENVLHQTVSTCCT